MSSKNTFLISFRPSHQLVTPVYSKGSYQVKCESRLVTAYAGIIKIIQSILVFFACWPLLRPTCFLIKSIQLCLCYACDPGFPKEIVIIRTPICNIYGCI